MQGRVESFSLTSCEAWPFVYRFHCHCPSNASLPPKQEWVFQGETDPVFHYWQYTLLIQGFPLVFGPIISTVNIMGYLQYPQVLSLVFGGDFQRLVSTLGELYKGAEGPQHTGQASCFVGYVIQMKHCLFPTKWLAAWHWTTDFLPNIQKPTPQQWVKVSLTICWLDPHTPSLCNPEGIC